MYIITTDPTHHIVEKYGHVSISADSTPGIQVTGPGNASAPSRETEGEAEMSMTTKRPVVSYNIDDNDVPIKFKDEYKQWCYTPEKGFVRRPYLSLSIVEPTVYKTNDEGMPILPVGEKVRIELKYNDPDKLGFNNLFENIKLKDRAGLFEFPNSVKLPKRKKSMEITIKSEDTGIMKLRAKDEKFVCHYQPLTIRFKKFQTLAKSAIK